MLFKMLAKERSWADVFQASMSKPRQLFVTQSQVLTRKVREYFDRLTQALATANLSPEELKLIAKTSAVKTPKDRLVDEDEEQRWNDALPKRYGELKDSDFPLFITYDHVSRVV